MEYAHDDEVKKDELLEHLSLGMAFDKACIAAEIPSALKTALLDDEKFMQRVDYVLAKAEAKWLGRLHCAAELASEKGDARSLMRILEVINPKRYAPSSRVAHSVEKSDIKDIQVNFVSALPTVEQEAEFELDEAVADV